MRPRIRHALLAAAGLAACAMAQFGWPQFGWLPAAQAQEARTQEVAAFARGSFEAIRKAHAGRPLIVHFWSVTCVICVSELAEWGKLARETPGVDFVFVNADPESDRHRALARMEKAGLKQSVNFAFADRFVERLYFEVDRHWEGELPFTAFVAANGSLRTEIGALTDLKLASWIDGKR